MPLTINLETEMHSKLGSVFDTENSLITAVEKFGRSKLRILGFLDPYGNTILNFMEAAAALEDLDLLPRPLQSSEGAVFEGVADLLRKCRDGMHLYVHFIGD